MMGFVQYIAGCVLFVKFLEHVETDSRPWEKRQTMKKRILKIFHTLTNPLTHTFTLYFVSNNSNLSTAH